MSSKNNDSLSISGHISWWNVQRWFDYSSNFWWFFSAIKYLDSSRSGFSSQGSIHETIRSHAKLTLDSIRHQRSPSSNMGVKHTIFNLDFLPQKLYFIQLGNILSSAICAVNAVRPSASACDVRLMWCALLLRSYTLKTTGRNEFSRCFVRHRRWLCLKVKTEKSKSDLLGFDVCLSPTVKEWVFVFLAWVVHFHHLFDVH